MTTSTYGTATSRVLFDGRMHTLHLILVHFPLHYWPALARQNSERFRFLVWSQADLTRSCQPLNVFMEIATLFLEVEWHVIQAVSGR